MNSLDPRYVILPSLNLYIIIWFIQKYIFLNTCISIATYVKLFTLDLDSIVHDFFFLAIYVLQYICVWGILQKRYHLQLNTKV